MLDSLSVENLTHFGKPLESKADMSTMRCAEENGAVQGRVCHKARTRRTQGPKVARLTWILGPSDPSDSSSCR